VKRNQAAERAHAQRTAVWPIKTRKRLPANLSCFQPLEHANLVLIWMQ